MQPISGENGHHVPLLANGNNVHTGRRDFGLIQPSVFFDFIGQFDLGFNGLSRENKERRWTFQTIPNMADFTNFTQSSLHLLSPLFR